MVFIFCLLFFILFKNSFDSIIYGKYSNARILQSGNYLIILGKGIFIYDSNFTLLHTVYEFDDKEKIENEEEFKKIAINEFEYNNNFYILILIKCSFLFLFENTNFQYNKYTFQENITIGNHYNINVNATSESNKIKAIITFVSKETKNVIPPDKYYFQINYYAYLLDLSSFNIITRLTKNIFVNRIFLYCKTESLQLQDIFLYCQKKYTNNIFFCFTNVFNSCTDNEMKINSLIYKIENYFKFLLDYNTSHYPIAKINNIKSSLSRDCKKNLICYRNMEFKSNCLYYDFVSNSFYDINNYHIENCLDLKTYFFNETNKYILICNIYNQENIIIFKIYDIK